MGLGFGFDYIDNGPPPPYMGQQAGNFGGSRIQKGFGMPPGYTQGPGQLAGGPVVPNQQPNQQYQSYFQQMHQGMDNLQEGLKQVEQMVMPGQSGQGNNYYNQNNSLFAGPRAMPAGLPYYGGNAMIGY